MKAFIKGSPLNLALYETMNAIWKEHKFGRIDENSFGIYRSFNYDF